jgi:hypothetical protein
LSPEIPGVLQLLGVQLHIFEPHEKYVLNGNLNILTLGLWAQNSTEMLKNQILANKVINPCRNTPVIAKTQFQPFFSQFFSQNTVSAIFSVNFSAKNFSVFRNKLQFQPKLHF